MKSSLFPIKTVIPGTYKPKDYTRLIPSFLTVLAQKGRFIPAWKREI